MAKVGVRPQPLIAVANVPASKTWYCALLGLEATSDTMASDHSHLYDRLLKDGMLVLQLHSWEDENHPNLVGQHTAKPGHGVLLWFEVDDFDATVARAKALKAEIVEDVHVNPAPQHRELWLRDADGYVVVVCSPDGEAA
jgi:catechol 2,3-dioxygenase-like lactoylglutathione lyase family enzyme